MEHLACVDRCARILPDHRVHELDESQRLGMITTTVAMAGVEHTLGEPGMSPKTWLIDERTHERRPPMESPDAMADEPWYHDLSCPYFEGFYDECTCESEDEIRQGGRPSTWFIPVAAPHEHSWKCAPNLLRSLISALEVRRVRFELPIPPQLPDVLVRDPDKIITPDERAVLTAHGTEVLAILHEQRPA